MSRELTCDAHQFSDQMICPCGLRWDVGDPHPPRCRVGRLSTEKGWLDQVKAARDAGIAVEPRDVSQAQRRLSRLYGGSWWDRAGPWVAGGAIGIAIIELIRRMW